MGKFEVNRFITEPDPDLICSVCCCILDDPLESPCQHVYCKVCITTWLNNQKSCPNCRSRLRLSRLKPVLPIVRNMINRLQIRCENLSRGCLQSVQLESYNSHINVCDYSIVKCKNNECKETVLRKNLKDHENQCSHRLTKCDKGCDLLLPLGKLMEHNCLSELKSKLQKVEDNLVQVTSKMTDIEKRVLVLERNLRTRPNRSPTFSFSRASSRRTPSPPIPWYSPSAPNDISAVTGRNERNTESEEQHQRQERESSSTPIVLRSVRQERDRESSTSPIILTRSQRQERDRELSMSPSYNRTSRSARRRSRSSSWSILQSTAIPSRSSSRSRSRSPIFNSSWSNQSVYSMTNPLSELSSDTTPMNSTEDESFYSEMNRSFSSSSPRSDVQDLNLEDVNNDHVVGEGNGENQVMAASEDQEESANNNQQGTNNNTSNTTALETVEGFTNLRRSSRLAVSRRNPSINNSADHDSGNVQPVPFSTVPVLSRNTIEEIMNALAETSGDESNYEPVTDVTPTNSSMEEETDGTCTGFSSSEDGHWTSILLNYDSSDTDDTWSIT